MFTVLTVNFSGQKFAMMELRTAIGEVIKHFELQSITKAEDVVIISDLILRAKDPIRVRFVARNWCAQWNVWFDAMESWNYIAKKFHWNKMFLFFFYILISNNY